MTGIMQAMVSLKPATVTQTPLVYLDANNSSSYPGTGTTVADLSGNGYTHSLNSAAQFTTLSGVKCFDCMSVSTYIVQNNSTVAPVLPTSGYTYISWARPQSNSAIYRTLFRCYGTTGDHPIIINQNTNIAGMWDNKTTTEFHSFGYDMSALVNTWSQWCVTGNNSSSTLYINGQLIGTISYGSGGCIHHAWGNIQGGGQGWGYVANMELYTSILPQQVIQQKYGTSKYTFG